jgi:PAS domain S-box-containing protein
VYTGYCPGPVAYYRVKTEIMKMTAPMPINEKERLNALKRYDILDSDPEQFFDDLVELASFICDAPISLITFIDEDRQWYKSKKGIEGSGSARDVAFCAHAIMQNELFIVPDALFDKRFVNNPYVTADPEIRFYAGAPLITSDGYALGTLCVLDRQPRELTAEQARAIKSLSRQVVAQLELRRAVKQLSLAQTELSQSKERFQRLANNLPDAIFHYRLQPPGFGFVSSAVTAITGYSAQAFYDNSNLLIEIIHPDERKRLAALLDHPTKVNEPYQAELFRLLRADGHMVWLELRTIPVYDQAGRMDAVEGIARDVTHRKQMEEEREQMIADLDAFAQTVAHDLKGPLSVILGYGELLTPERVSALEQDEIVEFATVISEYATKMNNIIQELFLLSSVRSDEVTSRPFAMGPVVEAALERLAYMIEDKEATITKPDTWPDVVGYEGWVEAVWVNYMSNALKYGGTPPVIELGADEQGEMVRFWVRDEGPGISPAEQRRLFVPFTRLDQVKHVEGHGLGLSIVQRIVEKLGGQVGVESQLGEGSLFYFTLPRQI